MLNIYTGPWMKPVTDTAPTKCYKTNTNLSGRVGSKTTENVGSWQACSELCRQEEDCSSWVWHIEKSPHYAFQCVTMTGYSGTVNEWQTVSGDKVCGLGKYLSSIYRVPQKYRLKVYGSEGHKNGANHILILCMFFSTSGHLV